MTAVTEGGGVEHKSHSILLAVLADNRHVWSFPRRSLGLTDHHFLVSIAVL